VGGYVEPGGSWRPFWLVAGALGFFLVLDLVLPGGDVPALYWSLPKGRTGLPLRLTDGRTVLVPTREPATLHEALLGRVSDTTGGSPGSQGTLGS
jgi:hypothetical protein